MMKRLPNLTVIFALTLLVMSGCTGGSWVSEAGDRGMADEEVLERESVGGEAGDRGMADEEVLEREFVGGSSKTNDAQSHGDFITTDLRGFEISEAQVEIIKEGFLQLSDVYVSPSGLIYVVDAMRHYLYRMDPVSSTIDSVGGRGQGNTQFWGPISVHATNDLKIFVQDVGNGRIQMFDRRFQFLGSLAMEGGSVMISESPSVGMGVNRAGGVVFWDEGGLRVVGSTSSYTIDKTFDPDVSQIQIPPSKLRGSPDGFVILDSDGSYVHRYTDNGRYIGFLTGFGRIIDVSLTENEWILLTEEFIVSASSTGLINKITRHLIDNPKTITHDKSGFIVSSGTKLLMVVI